MASEMTLSFEKLKAGLVKPNEGPQDVLEDLLKDRDEDEDENVMSPEDLLRPRELMRATTPSRNTQSSEW